jgi:4-amino-4-deoxy-L-arabinose transferase-like glycosyltransferase
VIGLFLLILAVGIWARVWQFSQYPAGLNQDEVASGVDAYNLLHFGIDRNGMSFPVYFVGYGSGMPPLFTYLLIPFVALLGLTPLAIRLPMLLLGCLTLPLVYAFSKRLLGTRFALLAMLFVAISPWAIMISRWGLDANSLPFFFTLAFTLLLGSTRDNARVIPAFAVFALCLYAYGSAFAAVPVFLLFAIIVLLRARRVRVSTLIWAGGVFLVLVLPLGLFLLVNLLDWPTLHLGVITVPHMVSQARFMSQTSLFSGEFWHNTLRNIVITVYLLLTQWDTFDFNALQAYGYFYRYTAPLMLLGIWMLLPRRKKPASPEKKLFLVWIAAALVIGILEPVLLNRIGLILIPLIVCVAVVVDWLWQKRAWAGVSATAVFCVAFVFFNFSYHSERFNAQIELNFPQGLVEALSYVKEFPETQVCVTDGVSMPYIYVLYSEKMDPQMIAQDIRYSQAQTEFRAVTSLGRYTFGLENCGTDSTQIYVVRESEAGQVPAGRIEKDFQKFRVYLPAQ